MTPRRYFTFACFTALIQGGVITSQGQSSEITLSAGTVLGSIQSINITIATHGTETLATPPTDHTQARKKTLTSPKKPEHRMFDPVKTNNLVNITSPVPEPKSKMDALAHTKAQKQTDAATEIVPVSKKQADVNSSRQLDTQTSQGVTQTNIALNQPTFSAPPSQPNYPKLARKRGFEGTATVEVMFNQIGEQLSLTLINSSGFNLLDNAALNAVKKWQFSAPSPQKAYAYTVRVPVRFALN